MLCFKINVTEGLSNLCLIFFSFEVAAAAVVEVRDLISSPNLSEGSRADSVKLSSSSTSLTVEDAVTAL